MTIHIEELTIDTIIGILDFERTSTQKVIIETKINYFYTENCFIDYAEVIKSIEKRVKTEKFLLLEEALESLGELILTSYPQIYSLFIKISKPNIIPNATVALSKEWINGT
jgi:dihydroneopterin aldolase